jgi:hypothetical protein
MFKTNTILMAKKKKTIYKGNAISAFKIAGQSYKVGESYETDIKERFDYLINLKKIKK